MSNFEIGDMEMSGSSGIDALFEREPELARPLKAGLRVRVASVAQLMPFRRMSAETLVHKSTEDLWAIKSQGGQYFIERLFDDHGAPLKG